MSNSISTRHIALFGGSFNPPHICHTLATLWVLQTQDVDELWWIPTYQHAFDKALAPFETRIAMCELAISDLTRVKIHRIEETLGGESRTIDTVQALHERYENTRFHLVIGADILEEVHRWKNWDGLMELVDLIVVGRKGYDHPNGKQIIDLDLPDISSTIIRQALENSDYESIGDWISRNVLEFIARENLYLRESCP